MLMGRPRRDPWREQGARGAVHSPAIHQPSKTGCVAGTQNAHRGRHGNETHVDRQAKPFAQKCAQKQQSWRDRMGSVSDNIYRLVGIKSLGGRGHLTESQTNQLRSGVRISASRKWFQEGPGTGRPWATQETKEPRCQGQ